jgi:hypothetical protein
MAISEWRAACTALRMLGRNFLASRRTCPRLSRVTLAASLLAAIPIVTLAQNGTMNGTGRAGVDFAAYIGADRIETVVAFTDAALLPVAGLSTPLRVTGGDGARVAYELVTLRPGFALVALSGEREQHFRICGASGCRQYRVVRGD